MLDGRCRARPRPDVVRLSPLGIRRSRATAADPGRRLLHRCRARRDADRGAPPGAGRSDRSDVDGHPRGPRARDRPPRRERCRHPQRAGPGPGDARRSGLGRAKKPPPRQNHADPEEEEYRGAVAGRRRKVGVPAKHPQKGLFNGGLWRVKSRAQSKSKIITMRISPDEDFGHKVTKVSVRGDCFGGAIESIPWEQRKPYDEFDYGYVLTVHKSQGSQWDDVVLFDESFAFQESRARWLYTGITRAAKRLSIVV